jgi:hypothetical protein
MSAAFEVSYVLPVRWRDGAGCPELTRYLREIAPHCAQIIVVDGSPAEVFAANARAWHPYTLHIAPDPDTSCKMGKVAGIRSGIRRASHEAVVIADDDVRYKPAELARVARSLDEVDLVVPQNYFDPLPWHARWDTARTLLNRALGGDFPGTLGIRRSRFLAMDGYDGDVIFENLELIRTVQATGGRTSTPLDLYVRRLPPTTSHFLGQRTRQAYDDFALPLRMACWLALLPLLTGILAKRSRWAGAIAAGLPVLVAERGRRRADGQKVFPASSSLLAPLWMLERGVCAWLAVLQRLRFGGIRYGEEIVPTAAHSFSFLQDRYRHMQPGSSQAPAQFAGPRPSAELADRVIPCAAAADEAEDW